MRLLDCFLFIDCFCLCVLPVKQVKKTIKFALSSPRNKYVILSVSLLKYFPVDAVVFGAEAHS